MKNAPRTTPQKLCLVTLALALLCAQLRDAMHKAQFRHVRCAEHGEWQHVAQSGSVAVASVRAAAPCGPQATSPQTSVGVDEHCSSLSPQRERLLAWNVRPSVAQRVTLPAARFTAERVREPDSIARYRLAPKHSPPCT